MKKPLFALALLILAGALSQAAQPSVIQKSDAVVPLKGLDPVKLAKGKEVKGDDKIAVTRGGFRYLFSSAENKALFEKEPKIYEIQMGGSCPVVPGAEGDPDRFVVYKERIYIFASDMCVESFKAKPEEFVKN
jgi:YHS domain-containing protein